MHNTVLGASKEIRTPTKAVQHPAAHHTRAVRMRVDVHFNGSVHADDAQTPDDLGRITDLLRAQDKFGRIVLPACVEALEAFG